jgi:Ser-tRNA(Ala) deacylase AlaX
MVKKLFWEDPYLRSTQAVVTGVQGETVTLDQTVAFAYPGGQVPDTGTIGSYEIVDAKYQDRDIYYSLPAGHTLKAGDPVEVRIDWDRRYRLMKLHFITELLLAVFFKQHGFRKLSRADILPDKALLEIAWEGDIAELFPELRPQLEKLVADDLEIISEFSDRENEKRYWEIAGLAKVNCGGTHLKTTGEIGSFALRRTPVREGVEGVEIRVF